MKKHRTLRKMKGSKRRSMIKRSSMSKRRSMSKKNQTKRIFFHGKKHKYRTRKQGGGGDGDQYPPVYGIENRAVLYPISKYGIPAGPFDPPALSNGPNGNGPYPGVLYGVYGGNGGGGKHKRKIRRSKYHVGGGSQSTFLPQSVVNTTRSLSGGLVEIVNGFGGHTNSASLNPLPYQQPIDQTTTF